MRLSSTFSISSSAATAPQAGRVRREAPSTTLSGSMRTSTRRCSPAVATTRMLPPVGLMLGEAESQQRKVVAQAFLGSLERRVLDPLEQAPETERGRLCGTARSARPRRAARSGGPPPAPRRCRAPASRPARSSAPVSVNSIESSTPSSVPGLPTGRACPSRSISSGGGCPASATFRRVLWPGAFHRHQAHGAEIGPGRLAAQGADGAFRASAEPSGRSSRPPAACGARAPSPRPRAAPCRTRPRSSVSSARRRCSSTS